MSTIGDTTSGTLVRFMGLNQTYSQAAVGNIGLGAQLDGATIEFSITTWNSFPASQFFDFLQGFVWIDLGSTPGAPDFRANHAAVIDTVSGGPSHEFTVLQGKIEFSALLPGNATHPFEHFEVTFSAPADIHGNPPESETIIIRGDEVITLGLTLQHFGQAGLSTSPDIGLIHIEYTSGGALPDLPSLFTDEQRDKFRSDARDLKTISLGLGALGGTVSDNPAANMANQAASQVASSVSAQVGNANAALQTALSMAEGLISVSTSPLGLIFGLAGLLNSTMAGILEFLADLDPPDSNYLETFDTPGWSFGPVAGAGAAGNAYLRETWALFGESLDLLAAAERFQGADLAGNATARAVQEAAFTAALARYDAQRVAVSESLAAYLADLRTSLPDLDFQDDTSLSDLQAYLSGLTDPATDDPLLAAFVASMAEAQPGLLALPDAGAPSFLARAIADAVAAIAGAGPSGLTGSVFDALEDAAGDLAVVPDGASTFTIGTGGDFATLAAAMASGQLAGGDVARLLAGLSGESATVTVDDLTVKGGPGNTGISLRLGAGIDSLTLDGAAPIGVTGNGRANVLIGNAGANALGGGGGADTLEGGDGRDDLTGGAGRDELRGGKGADILAGDGGNDVLAGGQDGDTFHFGRNGGSDIVRDFADNADTLRLDDRLWEGDLGRARVLRQFGEDVGGDVVLTFATGTLTLEDMTIAALRNDLVFV